MIKKKLTIIGEAIGTKGTMMYKEAVQWLIFMLL